MHEIEGANTESGFGTSPLQSADGTSVNLCNHFRSTSGFLICSGPSLRNTELACLQSRGILTCTVNNAGTVFRSNLWVAYDKPGNFSDVIWKDPGILKFIPVQRLNQTIRSRDIEGELVNSIETAGEMPATFGYKTNLNFRPDGWLTENSINCGDNEGKETDDKGQRGTRSVMLAALRLLYYLGVRRVFLLGCDFHMSYGSDNYGFRQARTRRSIRMNNHMYRTLNERFRILLPYFGKERFEVFNCTPNSGLSVFPFIDLESAVNIAISNVPKRIETIGMYD